ncbi:MAG: hypothetical protein D6813_00610 [Calditrichaeota bacterium]|nr:MAG: hypothetical protein D6813_00610 [Calditrichota bacterium]
MKKIIILMGLFLIIKSSFAQNSTGVTQVGTSSAAFLKIDVGARAMGMGGAYVAVATDATAIYWNPAGIARVQSGEATLMHTNWLAGTNFDFGAIVVPLSFGSIGVSITSLTMGDMEVRTVEQPEGTGEFFSASDVAAGVSYALNLTDRFSIGFNAKYIRSTIFNESATSVAFDIGTLFTTELNNMRIGVSLLNLGTDMRLNGRDLIILVDPAPQKDGSNDRIVSKLQTDSFSLPLMLRVGVAMDFFKTENNQLTLAIDGTNPSDGPEGVNLGAEYNLRNSVFFRAGYQSLFVDDAEQGITAGVGFRLKLLEESRLRFDYAYADFGRFNNIQRFSITIEF